MFAAGKTARGSVATTPVYIEEIFSTWLYTGNDSGVGTNNQIINNIDLSTKGGLVWMKSRASGNHWLADTVRGRSSYISSNTTSAETYSADSNFDLKTFNTDGFSLGRVGSVFVNEAGVAYASWTFRKQPKFFDVVTYTGTGSATTIAHNLGSVPGCIIVKRTDAADIWAVWHNSLTNAFSTSTNILSLSETTAQQAATSWFNGTQITSTAFGIKTNSGINASGGTYVAHLFANNSGGFGLTGTDNVITCGSYTGNGSTTGPVINIGYEPQWLMVKNASGVGSWYLVDNMRGITADGSIQTLYANLSNAEATSTAALAVNATGFQPTTTSSALNGSGSTYIYIAIRRGPMKVPTDATKVFSPVSQASHGTVTTNFPVDLSIATPNTLATDKSVIDRLRGNDRYLYTNSTNADSSYGSSYTFNYANNTGFVDTYFNSGFNIAYWNFRRAPGFFDEVCYTGTGSATTVTHNLGVAPEFIIVKSRSGARAWLCYQSTLGNTQGIRLDGNFASVTDNAYWNSTTPTSTVFTVGTDSKVNASGEKLVAYLFATCAGVSKVGSYTGNGSTQTINCGFTGGARFVLIKRTDAAGDWYVYDTARGMTTLTDPYLLLNSTAAESATLGSVTTVSTGFAVNASILAAINTNGASYIFLAIA